MSQGNAILPEMGFASDFDADKRLRLYNNRLNTATFEYTFHHAFNASDVPGGIPAADGWHHMKVEVRTLSSDTTAFWCYFDGEMLTGSPIYDTGSDRVSQGHFGLFSFQQSVEGIPGYFDNIVVKSLAPASSVGDAVNAASGDLVLQTHPNPFSQETSLSYSLSSSGFVTLTIHDLLGRQVRQVVHAYARAGDHVARWNGDDEIGNPVPPGTYVCRLASGNGLLGKTIVLTR